MTSRLLSPRRPRVVGPPSASVAGGTNACDLSANVRADLGYFDARDELFRVHGQTLCPAARLVVDPVLSRHSA